MLTMLYTLIVLVEPLPVMLVLEFSVSYISRMMLLVIHQLGLPGVAWKSLGKYEVKNCLSFLRKYLYLPTSGSANFPPIRLLIKGVNFDCVMHFCLYRPDHNFYQCITCPGGKDRHRNLRCYR